MKRGGVVPPSDLLEQVAGVEETLQRGKRLGAVGWLAAVVAAVQFGLAAANAYGRLILPSDWTQWLVASGAAFVVLAVVLRQWLRFWIHESRRSFRYVYSISEFPALGETHGINLSSLHVVISSRLSERISRLSRIDGATVGKKAQPSPKADDQDSTLESRVHIEGTWEVRRRRDEVWHIVVTPWIRVGPPGRPMSLAHPVTFVAQAAPGRIAKPDRLTPEDYDKLIERIYFSIASEIYKQIRESVERRIRLLPWRRFRAAAYFQEAEDYVRSNTLDAYRDARDLYLQVIKMYDPTWIAPPTSSWRHLLHWIRRWRAAIRWRLSSWGSHLSRRLGNAELMVARAYIGYASALTYSRMLAGLSGQRINPVFEARLATDRAIFHIKRLPDHVRGHRAANFEAKVTEGLVMGELRSPGKAHEALAEARSREPQRKESDARYLFVRGYLEPNARSGAQFLRRAVEANPEYEVAQFELAKTIEMDWRSQPAFDPDVAKSRVLLEYNRVVDLNPANIAAWTNMAYVCWLLKDRPHPEKRKPQASNGEPTDFWIAEAKRFYERGWEYKEIKRATFISQIDYGLARVTAEMGDLHAAYRHYLDAAAAKTATGTAHEVYTADQTFACAGQALVDRFERYRDMVSQQRAGTSRKSRNISLQVRNVVWAFALNDFGEACYATYEQTGDVMYRREALAAFEKLCNPPFDRISVIPHLNLHRLRADDSQYMGEQILRVVKMEPYWTAANLELLLFHGRRRHMLKAKLVEARSEVAKHVQEAKLQLQPVLEGSKPDGHARRSLGSLATGSLATVPEPEPLSPGRTTGSGRADPGLRRALAARAWVDVKRARRIRASIRNLDREADRAIRALVTHRWLWNTKDGHLDLTTLSKKHIAREHRWEREFDDYHVESLRAWSTYSVVSDRLALVSHLRKHYWWEDFQLLLDNANALRSRPVLDDDKWASNRTMRLLKRRFRRSADARADSTTDPANVYGDLSQLIDTWRADRVQSLRLRDLLANEASAWICRSAPAIDLMKRVMTSSRAPALSIWIGNLLWDLKHRDSAVHAWRRAIEQLKGSRRGDLLLAAGNGLRLAGEYDAALNAAVRATKLISSDARRATSGLATDSHLLVAQCHWHLGRWSRATQVLSGVPPDNRDRPLWRRDFIESVVPISVTVARESSIWYLRDWLEAERLRHRGTDDSASVDVVAALLSLQGRCYSTMRAEDGWGRLNQATNEARLVVDAHPELFQAAAEQLLNGGGLLRLANDVRLETGVDLPAIRVRAGEGFPQGWFRISLDEVPVLSGRAEDQQTSEEALMAALREVSYTCIGQFVGVQEVANLLRQWSLHNEHDRLRERVEDLLRHPGKLNRLVSVLQCLVRDRVSLVDIAPALDVVTARSDLTHPEAVADAVRTRLDPEHLGITDDVHLLRFAEGVDGAIPTPGGRWFADRVRIETDAEHEIVDMVGRALAGRDRSILVVSDAANRRLMQHLTERHFPTLRVVTLNDVLRSNLPRPLAFTRVGDDEVRTMR